MKKKLLCLERIHYGQKNGTDSVVSSYILLLSVTSIGLDKHTSLRWSLYITKIVMFHSTGSANTTKILK
jgi:hypothetical protein